jgi:hypothetical protein
MADEGKAGGMAPEDAAALAALAPFFAAARTAPPEPALVLRSAILADAAEAVPPSAPTPTRRRALAPAFGFWRGAAALAACALLGFWLGLAGSVTIDGATLQAGTAVAADSADPIETFFDLAAME